MAAILNLQDMLLNRVRKTRGLVTVFLVNGFQMRGVVTGFYSFVIVLDSDGRQHMIYKHAVSTIVPFKSVEFTNEGRDMIP